MVLTATVRDRHGETRQISRAAPSSSAFAEDLRGEGFVVLSIVEAEAPRQNAAKPRRRFFRRMPSFDVEMGLRQLASMLASGVTLMLALRTVAEQAATRRAGAVWSDVADAILAGTSFSQALARDGRTFGEVCVRLAEVGERSGELEHALSRAAEQLESARTLRTAVVNALVYPVLTLLLTAAVCGYLVVCVIPKLGEFLSEAGGALPAMTQMLLDVSGGFRQYAPEIAVGVCAGAALWQVVRLNESGREGEDLVLLRLPVVGKILRVSGTAMLARSLQIMTESGVTMLEALETAGKIVANRRLRRRVVEARARILGGASLAEALAEAKEFMPMLRHMAAVGEVSGSLPGAFGETARFHELILAMTIKRLGILIEPVMIVVTGLVVGFVYVAFFMALFAMVTAG